MSFLLYVIIGHLTHLLQLNQLCTSEYLLLQSIDLYEIEFVTLYGPVHLFRINLLKVKFKFKVEKTKRRHQHNCFTF